MSFRLVYWDTYRHIHPKKNVPVYPHAFLWSNNKYLPVSTTASVPAHRCTLFMTLPVHFNTVFLFSSTRPRFCWSTFEQTYLFGLFLIFLHILRKDLSTGYLLRYLPTDPPENQCTCLFLISIFFGHVLFHVMLYFILCDLQQYSNSAYNKLNSLQQKVFINITKRNYIWKRKRKKK